MHAQRDAEGARRRRERSPTRSCSQLLFGRGKRKLHQPAESQLIFPIPKTVDIQNYKRVQLKNHRQHHAGTNNVKRTDKHKKKHKYIYTTPYESIYISLSLSQNIRCRRSKLHSKHNAQMIMLENKQLHWRTGVQHFFTLQMGKSSRPLSGEKEKRRTRLKIGGVPRVFLKMN